jgi:protein-disulfide isomerase
MASRQAIRERRKKQRQKQRTTTILIIVGIALILTAIIMIPVIRNAVTPVGDFIVPEPNQRPMQQANAAGNPEAPVVMEIFSDFGCGHCGNFAQTTGELIMAEYVATGQVYMVFNSVGGLLGHPNSITTIEAAYCASEQNKFWQYHDILFANQGLLFANINQNLDKTFLAFAEALDMDTDSFKSCIKDNRYNQEIQGDLAQARDAEISSTPSFLIDGILVIGNQSYPEFRSAIESALARAQQ